MHLVDSHYSARIKEKPSKKVSLDAISNKNSCHKRSAFFQVGIIGFRLKREVTWTDFPQLGTTLKPRRRRTTLGMRRSLSPHQVSLVYCHGEETAWCASVDTVGQACRGRCWGTCPTLACLAFPKTRRPHGALTSILASVPEITASSLAL